MTPRDQEAFLHVFHTEACSDADAPVASNLQYRFPTRRHHLRYLGVARASCYSWVPTGFAAGSGRSFLPARLPLEVRTEGIYFYSDGVAHDYIRVHVTLFFGVTAFVFGAI